MSIFTIHGHKRSVDEENPYWLSFSDIMSGLLIIFILASLYLMLELEEKKDLIDASVIEMMEANTTRSEILHEIKAELMKKDIQVDVVDNDGVVRIPSDQLHFGQGRYEIPESKTLTVNQIGKTIYKEIIQPKRIKLIDTIFIEGHTDSIPAGKIYRKGNWELSTMRAIEVWEHWQSISQNGYDSRFDKLLNKKGDPIVSVSGFADTRRVVEKEMTKNDFSKNRRIDIRFTMKQPDYKSILDLQKQAQ